jgi:hypothetical protein
MWTAIRSNTNLTAGAAATTAITSITAGDHIAVIVRVRWTDGTESDHTGTTGQWTRSHVYVAFDDLPNYVGAGG